MRPERRLRARPYRAGDEQPLSPVFIYGMAGCDKSLPGMLMAAARLNVPSVFLYGGNDSNFNHTLQPWNGSRVGGCCVIIVQPNPLP